MIPLGDDQARARPPVCTALLLGALSVSWLVFQGAGFDAQRLAASVCNLGLVPGELTGEASLGTGVPIGPNQVCVVDDSALNWLTPFTSMFLHGSWGHIAGNALFLWVFGRTIEDGMGRLRFLFFYLLCGLAGAAAQVAVNPGSAVPMVGASGAIAGVLGGYLALYPMARIQVLFIWLVFVQRIDVRAVFMLLWWIGIQLISGLPQLGAVDSGLSGGVAFWAHIGGFVAGVLLVKVFSTKALLQAHARATRRLRRL